MKQQHHQNTPALVSIGQSLKILYEISSTYPVCATTHPISFPHGQQQPPKPPGNQISRCVRAEFIKTLATDKFARKGEGLTYFDLYKGKNKVVDTSQQAKNLLQYHTKRKNLHANYPMTIPQQYFADKDQVLSAAAIQEYKERTTHAHPTGVKSSQNGLTAVRHAAAADSRSQNSRSRSYSIYTIHDMDHLKAENFNQAMEFIAANDDAKEDGRAAAVSVGIHKILIHLNVYKGKAEEAYYERLHDVAPDPDNNNAKTLVTDITISGNCYPVKADVYPKGKIIIDVSCTDSPFPIWLEDDQGQNTSKAFLTLLANIRCFLMDRMRDYRSTIIPPSHNPVWRLKNCDINFDIPTTAINFHAFPNLQVKQFYQVVYRIYAKMLNAKPHIRFEKACHNFDILITEDIGSKIMMAAIAVKKEVQQELRKTGVRLITDT